MNEVLGEAGLLKGTTIAIMTIVTGTAAIARKNGAAATGAKSADTMRTAGQATVTRRDAGTAAKRAETRVRADRHRLRTRGGSTTRPIGGATQRHRLRTRHGRRRGRPCR